MAISTEMVARHNELLFQRYVREFYPEEVNRVFAANPPPPSVPTPKPNPLLLLLEDV